MCDQKKKKKRKRNTSLYTQKANKFTRHKMMAGRDGYGLKKCIPTSIYQGCSEKNSSEKIILTMRTYFRFME